MEYRKGTCGCVLIVLLIFYTNIRPLTSQCVHGTTPACIFPCHCNHSCASSSASAVDPCSSGCDESPLVPWSGAGCQRGNIALGKQAWHGPESTRNADVAGNCVDDNIDEFDASSSTCCGLYRTSNYTWEVSLGGDYVVEMVNFVRLSSVSISFLNISVDNHLCKALSSWTSDHGAIQCDTPVVGRNVHVSGRNRETRFACEIQVIGYQYYECKIYDDKYYYGPACLEECTNCAMQCDRIHGICDECLPGFSGHHCLLCDSGYWGFGCLEQCNCADPNEACEHVSGQCTSSGCADWYMFMNCSYAMPRLGSVRLEHVKSVDEIVTFTLDTAHLHDSGSVEYIAQIRIPHNEWLNQTTTWTEENTEIYVTLPILETVFEIRVIPFDLKFQVLGEPTPYSSVYGTRQPEEERPKEMITTITLVLVVVMFVSFVLNVVLVVIVCRCRHQPKETPPKEQLFQAEVWTPSHHNNTSEVLNDGRQTPEPRAPRDADYENSFIATAVSSAYPASQSTSPTTRSTQPSVRTSRPPLPAVPPVPSFPNVASPSQDEPLGSLPRYPAPPPPSLLIRPTNDIHNSVNEKTVTKVKSVNKGADLTADDLRHVNITLMDRSTQSLTDSDDEENEQAEYVNITEENV